MVMWPCWCRCVFYSAVVLLNSPLVSLRISPAGYVTELCVTDVSPVRISCQQDEIIRIRRTLLSAVPTAPGQPATCENPDRNNFCRAPTNRSDSEFVARQSASYPIQAEDLYTHPERKGECYAGVRSNVAQVFYECVPKQGGYLQSVCSDILWENEVTGYLISPYFPGTYPAGQEELDCHCELTPDTGSRVELVGLLMNPSTSGLTWTIEMDSGTGFSQEISTQFYVSRLLSLPSTTGTIKLRFRSWGSGQQQPSRIESPPGFWLEYKALLTNPQNWLPGDSPQAGRVTLTCNDPYTNPYLAGIVAGTVVPLVLIIIIIIVAIVLIRRRKRNKGESYSTDQPARRRAERGPDDSRHQNKAYLDSEEHQPYNHNHYRQRPISADDYPEKEHHQYGRSGRGRTYSNNSYNDKVFLDEVDKKSIPSSGRTGDNDSIAKKSLSESQDSQYSEVNYSPKGPRHSSLGRDTAV